MWLFLFTMSGDRTTKMRRRRTISILAATLQLGVCSFGFNVGRSAAAPRPRSLPRPAPRTGDGSASAPPLFATTESTSISDDVIGGNNSGILRIEKEIVAHNLSDDIVDGSSAALRSIEKEIEAYNRKREKALRALNKFEADLQVLVKKKTEYLEGIKLGKTPEGGNFSETTLRSAIKSMMWRVIAGLVTLATSLRFSGSLKTALSIVGSDFFSKAATMFIGERLMNKSKAGRKKGADGVGRSLAKVLIWRLFAICNTLTMSLLISKDLSMASKIAGSDAIFKTGLMFVYERAWSKVERGKEYQIEFAI